MRGLLQYTLSGGERPALSKDGWKTAHRGLAIALQTMTVRLLRRAAGPRCPRHQTTAARHPAARAAAPSAARAERPLLLRHRRLRPAPDALQQHALRLRLLCRVDVRPGDSQHLGPHHLLHPRRVAGCQHAAAGHRQRRVRVREPPPPLGTRLSELAACQRVWSWRCTRRQRPSRAALAVLLGRPGFRVQGCSEGPSAMDKRRCRPPTGRR